MLVLLLFLVYPMKAGREPMQNTPCECFASLHFGPFYAVALTSAMQCGTKLRNSFVLIHCTAQGRITSNYTTHKTHTEGVISTENSS